MAQTGGGVGTLSHLAQTRRRVIKSRELLGLSARGIQKPQLGPPPVAPADTRPPQTVLQPGVEGAPGAEPNARARMRQQAAQFLQTLQAGGQGQPAAQNAVAPVTVGEPGVNLAERVRQAGAEALSPEMQFYRITGRPASPRQLAVFSSRMMLEQQLGRAPTVQELKEFISRPEAISPAFPVAFEG